LNNYKLTIRDNVDDFSMNPSNCSHCMKKLIESYDPIVVYRKKKDDREYDLIGWGACKQSMRPIEQPSNIW